jgi:hypothetical protein
MSLNDAVADGSALMSLTVEECDASGTDGDVDRIGVGAEVERGDEQSVRSSRSGRGSDMVPIRPTSIGSTDGSCC